MNDYEIPFVIVMLGTAALLPQIALIVILATRIIDRRKREQAGREQG